MLRRLARAAVYDEPNAPFSIREYPLRAVRADEVLVKVKMSTICRSDIHSYHGHRPNPCPGILGHEIIGVIDQLGREIERDLRGDPLAVGDRITWTEYFHEGDSYYRDVHDMPQKARGVRKYGHDLVEEDPHFTGGFAEYCYILPGTGILKLPDELSDEEATPINCGVATMVCVTEATRIQMGDVVAIQGLGLLGLYGCAMAKTRGARRVIGLDAVPDRLEAAKRFGADVVIDVAGRRDDDIVAQVHGHAPPDGVDAVIEVCGVPAVIPSGLGMFAHGRTVHARRDRHPRCRGRSRCQSVREEMDCAARHSQLPPPAPDPGPGLCRGQPRALPVQGDRGRAVRTR